MWGKQTAIPSLPPLQNDREQSVNDRLSCFLGNLAGNRLPTVINKVLASILVTKKSVMHLAPGWEWGSTVRQWLLALHHSYWQLDVAVIFYIHCFDSFCTSTSSRTLSGGYANGVSCFCRGGCGGNMLCIFTYTGCHVLVYGCLRSSASNITEAARPKIINAPKTLISKIG